MAYESTHPSNAEDLLRNLKNIFEDVTEEELEKPADVLYHYRILKEALVERTVGEIFGYDTILSYVLEDGRLIEDLLDNLYKDHLSEITDHSDFESAAKAWAESNGYVEADDVDS